MSKRDLSHYDYDDDDEVSIGLQATTGARIIVTAASRNHPRRDLARGRAFRCAWSEAKLWLQKLDGKHPRFPGAFMYVLATGTRASAGTTTAGGTLMELGRTMGTNLSPGFANLLAELVGEEKVLAAVEAVGEPGISPEIEEAMESLMDDDPGMPEDVARYLAARTARQRREGAAGKGALAKDGVEPAEPADKPKKKAAAKKEAAPKKKAAAKAPAPPRQKGSRKIAAPPKKSTGGTTTSADVPKIE